MTYVARGEPGDVGDPGDPNLQVPQQLAPAPLKPIQAPGGTCGSTWNGAVGSPITAPTNGFPGADGVIGVNLAQALPGPGGLGGTGHPGGKGKRKTVTVDVAEFQGAATVTADLRGEVGGQGGQGGKGGQGQPGGIGGPGGDGGAGGGCQPDKPGGMGGTGGVGAPGGKGGPGGLGGQGGDGTVLNVTYKLGGPPVPFFVSEPGTDGFAGGPGGQGGEGGEGGEGGDGGEKGSGGQPGGQDGGRGAKGPPGPTGDRGLPNLLPGARAQVIPMLTH
jgi:hypothetical protein